MSSFVYHPKAAIENFFRKFLGGVNFCSISPITSMLYHYSGYLIKPPPHCLDGESKGPDQRQGQSRYYA